MKYLLYSDIEHLLKKRKTLIIFFIISPLIIALININLPISFIEMVNMNIGTNIRSESGILEIIMYLLNISTIIYIITDLFIRDIKYQLDNIFLRKNLFVWFWGKVILFILILIIIKLFQYLNLILAIILFTNQAFDISIFGVIITDLIYVILVGFVFLLTYVMSLVYKKIKVFLIFFLLIFIIVLPKSIYLTKNYNIFILLIIILIQLIISIIIKNKNKKIIENL